MTSIACRGIILISFLYYTLEWCLKSSYNQLTEEILQVDWSPDGQYIVTASKSKRVTVFSVSTSNVVWFDTFTADVTTAKFSKTGKWLGVGQMGSDTIKIYNVPTFTLNISFSAEHTTTNDDIFQLDFNSDDTKIITCGSDGYVNQRNLLTNINQWKAVTVATKSVLTCKYSTTDRVGCFCDKDMYLLNADGTIFNKKAKDIIRDVDFRPGGHQYLYGGCTCDNKLKQYDTAANAINDYFNTQDDIYAVSYAPDGSFVATGGKRGHFNIYNTTNLNTPTKQAYYQQIDVDINSLRVSDDSNFVAVSRIDGVIDIYARNCIICPHGFYNNKTLCRMCTLDILHCANCKNSTLCYFCFSGYYLNPVNVSQCIICRNAIIGCLLCKSNTVCIDCTQGYYLTGNNCTACASFTPNCEQCHNNGTCIKCSYATYLTSTNTCSLCSGAIPNCRTCYLQYNTTSATNSTLYCRQCVSGYYASLTQCLACSSDCLLCSNTGTCIACAQQFRLTGTTCTRCSQYCEACNQNGTCYQCIPTTFLLSGSCSVCRFPCLTCVTTATTCRTCALGYYFNSGSSTCLKCVNCPFCNPVTGACVSCPIGRYLASGSCANCLNITSDCAICSPTACLLCQRNYYLTGTSTCARSVSINDCQIYRKNSTTVCEHCKLGFYLDTATSTCFRCMSSCSLCDNPNNCTQCQTGFYFINTNSTCALCVEPCQTCNTSTQCLSCGQEYYLSGTQCLKCWDQIPYCNSCLNSTHCVDCYLGYRLASNSLSCTLCASPCTTCNSSGCLSCQLGYFYQSNSCIRCSTGCSACTSLTNCNQCLSTYVKSGSNCVLCENLFPNCQSCSATACTFCKPYFTLSSGSCNTCNSSIANCLSCANGLCQSCSTGNYPASNALSCISCSVTMPWCQKCVNGTACDQCSSGFYISAVNICSKCTDGCRVCSNSSTCDICDTGFVLASGSICQSCSQYLLGCKMCTLLGGCYQCSIEYYLASSSSCLLCRSAMIGCISCSSNNVCSSCDSGYFLNSSSKCQACNIVGCQTCNQTTSLCISCMSGFFLTTSFSCSLCSSTLTNCDLCNSTHCHRCDSGSYLSPLGQCNNCNNLYQACILCNSTQCLQCQAGYYLHISNGSCQICNLAGCEVCSSNGASCLTCQNTYYLVGSLCQPCHTMDFGCLSCSGINSCLLCKSGYYLQTNGTCLLCSSQFTACQTCTSSRCQVCKTNYFQNMTSLTTDCVLCNSYLEGCSLCLDQNQCLVCESGYYMQSTQCVSCTIISQCLICSDNSTCLFCSAGYYLQNGQCLLCSNAILGCFSCISSTVCQTCGGSYAMTAGGICQIIKGVPPKNFTHIKLKSYYVNQTHIRHTLYVTEMEFIRIQQDWSSITDIQVITPPDNSIKLTVLGGEWGSGIPLTSLHIYTNNPFPQISSNQNLPFFKPTKRILLSLQQLNIAIYFQMQKSAIDQILPDLDTNGFDLSMEYMLNQPQFYRSIIQNENQRNYYYLFGIAVTSILVFGYFVKIMCLCSITTDAGDIIPHVLLNKVSAMIIYPTLGGYINYCYGFTYIDIPWLNRQLSQLLSNLSDQSPSSYKMFYNNLNIASTYLLGFIAFIVLYLPLYIYVLCKNRNKNLKIKAKSKMLNLIKQTSQKGSQNSDEKQLQKKINRLELLTEFIYNIFSGGLIFASFINIIGMLMNPSQILSISGTFYILGTFIFIIMLINAIKSFVQSKIKFNRLRVVIKACLMALMYWSPVLLFAALAIIDIGMIAIEYRYKIKQWVVPKAWIVCNLLNIMSYASLIFLSNMILGLLISAICIIAVLCIDVYLIYTESQQYDKIKKLRNYRLDSSMIDFTIQQFEPEKNENKVDNAKNFYFQDSQLDQKKDNKQKSTQIQECQRNIFSSPQPKENNISKVSLLVVDEQVPYEQTSKRNKTPHSRSNSNRIKNSNPIQSIRVQRLDDN